MERRLEMFLAEVGSTYHAAAMYACDRRIALLIVTRTQRHESGGFDVWQFSCRLDSKEHGSFFIVRQ